VDCDSEAVRCVAKEGTGGGISTHSPLVEYTLKVDMLCRVLCVGDLRVGLGCARGGGGDKVSDLTPGKRSEEVCSPMVYIELAVQVREMVSA